MKVVPRTRGRRPKATKGGNRAGGRGTIRVIELSRVKQPSDDQQGRYFELLVKSITAFVTLLASRFLGWVQWGAPP